MRGTVQGLVQYGAEKFFRAFGSIREPHADAVGAQQV